MKKILFLLVILLPFFSVGQNYDIVKSISRNNCDLNFYNQYGNKIASVNLNEMNFWNKSDGSFFIKDNKLQVTVTSVLTSPSFGSLTTYLNDVKDSCVGSGGGSVTIPQPLYVIDTSHRTDTICLPDRLEVNDSISHLRLDSLLSFFIEDSCPIYDIVLTPIQDNNSADGITYPKAFNVYGFPMHNHAELTFPSSGFGLTIDGSNWSMPNTTAPNGNGYEFGLNFDLSSYCQSSNISALSYNLQFNITSNATLANVYIGIIDGNGNQVLFNTGQSLLSISSLGFNSITLIPDIIPTISDLANYSVIVLFSQEIGLDFDGSNLSIDYVDNCGQQIVGYNTSLPTSLTECTIDALGATFLNSTANLATEANLNNAINATDIVANNVKDLTNGIYTLRDIVYDKIFTSDYMSITIDDNEGRWTTTLNPILYIPTTNITVNWGDGMVEDFYSTTPNHTYSDRGIYNIVLTYGDQSLRKIIRYQVQFTSSNSTIGTIAYAYEYKPVYQYTNTLAPSIGYTDLAGTTYSFTGLKIYDKLEVEQELKALEFEEKSYQKETKVYYGYYEDLSKGNIIDLETVLNDYLANVEGISAQLKYAKKITITNANTDMTHMHIGSTFIGDNHTRYDSKEGYTFFNDGRLYKLRDIYIYNNSTSASKLNFTFEIEY